MTVTKDREVSKDLRGGRDGISRVAGVRGWRARGSAEERQPC